MWYGDHGAHGEVGAEWGIATPARMEGRVEIIIEFDIVIKKKRPV